MTHDQTLTIDAAQTAEKMVGLIEEHGWCSGTLCVTISAAASWKARFAKLNLGMDAKQLTRSNPGALCLQGAAIIALGIGTHAEFMDDSQVAWDGETKLADDPIWHKLSDGHGWEWNDNQASAEPVIDFLRQRAATLYDEVGL